MTKKLLTALITATLSVFAVACGDAGGPIEGEAELGEEVHGEQDVADEVEVFEAFAAGNVRIDLIVDDLSSNEQPLEEICFGAIELDVAGESLVGDGRCFLPANFMDYSLNAAIAEDGAVQGEISVVLNGKPHELPLTGSFTNGSLSLAFDGVTIIVGNIRGVWNGTIDAEFD